MFRGRFAMNDPCPVCGLVFQREEGYFLGAMYVSYVLSTAVLGILYLLATTLLATRDNLPVTLAMLLLYVPLVPAVFRYSRVLWVYFERASCPGDLSAGAYEKHRQQQATPPAGPAGGGLLRR
jgi:hypothetical protein